MSRMTVMLDDAMLEDARAVLGTKTKRETIVVALTETIRRKRLEQAVSRRGRIGLDLTQEDLCRLREQP
jgi:Arc/MetJ family transcription regulator